MTTGFVKDSAKSISEFTDSLAKDLLDQAKEAASLPLINISNTQSVEIESEISQLSTQASANKELMHTMEFLKDGKQVRCTWCSRVNLIERNTTLKCLECNKGFCRNHCWSHHVAHGWVPAAQKYWTKKEGGLAQNEQKKRVFV